MRVEKLCSPHAVALLLLLLLLPSHTLAASLWRTNCSCSFSLFPRFLSSSLFPTQTLYCLLSTTKAGFCYEIKINRMEGRRRAAGRALRSRSKGWVSVVCANETKAVLWHRILTFPMVKLTISYIYRKRTKKHTHARKSKKLAKFS